MERPKLHETQVFFSHGPAGNSPLTVFQRKNTRVNEKCVRRIPDGRRRLIVMHSEFSTATRSVVSTLGHEADVAHA